MRACLLNNPALASVFFIILLFIVISYKLYLMAFAQDQKRICLLNTPAPSSILIIFILIIDFSFQSYLVAFPEDQMRTRFFHTSASSVCILFYLLFMRVVSGDLHCILNDIMSSQFSVHSSQFFMPLLDGKSNIV